jgi:YD repeat-containing protein
MVLKGLESYEEADAGLDVPGLGQPGLRAGDDGVSQAPGEPWELWSWGIRPLVPDEPRLPSGPGIAAAVHPGLADDLTEAPRPVPTAGPDLVDVATGDVRLVHEDVRLPVGPGVLPLVIGRVYRSSWRAGRWFGPSWASSFDQRLQAGPERVIGVFADGRVLCWLCGAGDDGRSVPVTGVPVTGPRWRLERAGDGFTVTDPQAGLVWRFEPGPGPRGDLPLVSVTDRGGHQVSFGYTPEGQPAWIAHSAGYRVRVVMNGARISGLSLTDPAGERPDVPLAGYRYDPARNLAGIVGASGQALRICYDAEGRLTGWRDRSGFWYRYTHDEQGRCVASDGPDGAMSVRFSYGDRVTWRTDAAGAVTIYQVDGASRVTAVTSALGHVTHLWYGEYGQLTARADPLGRLTRYGYDERGNLTCVTRPDGIRTEFGYDHALRLTAVTRAGLTWHYTYDAAGQMVAATDADGAATRYAYDAAGQLTGRVNAAGQETCCAYDDLGRLTRRVAGGVVSTFSYDAAGRLVQARNPDAEIRLTRDPLGRVTAETCNDRTVLSSWDRAGRRSRRVTPGGAQQRWEYDQAGQPVLLDAGGQTIGFGYDQAGRENRRDLPGGLTLTQDWDAAGRLTGQVLASGGRVLARREYAYQAGGRLDRVDELLAGGRRFTRDGAGRITAVDGDRWAERYRHDRQGRVTGRLRERTTGEPAVWAYEWDADDRLTAVTAPDGSTWRYRYDPLGRRIGKQRFEPSGAAAQETTFTWDGAVLAEEATRLPGQAGHWRRVTWDHRPGTPTPLAQTESLPAGDGGERFYAVITDQAGTPAELVSADGTIAGYRQHTLSGGTMWHPAGAATALRSGGRYHDAETGLHCGRRYYDPVTAGYLSPDPLGPDPWPELTSHIGMTTGIADWFSSRDST